MNKIFSKLSHERKMFLIFLLVTFVIFSGIGLIRTVLPTDSLEGIYWGSLHDFGTPKHPPLAGWLTYFVYHIFKCDYSVYALCMTFITAGFYYIYKLAKFFLDDTKAILSSVIIGGCWAYTYVTSYYGFNPDVVLLGLLPVITYYGYKCMTENKFSDWIILGVTTGICFLNKYQTALIILPMLIWALMYKREIFKMKRFYMSIIIAFLIFLPHLLWLIKYDFFPLLYFEDELSTDVLTRHVTAPLMFFFMQILAVIGTLLTYALLKLINKGKNNNEVNFKLDSKSVFILLVGIFPLVIHVLMGVISGGTMRPRWGYEFLYMTGIILFYFFPIKEISKKDFDFVFKCIYVIMGIVAISMTTLLGVEKNYRSRYPVAHIHNDLIKIWEAKYNTPLKYIGGYIEWTLPLTIYSKTHPDCILDTNGYPNPWVPEEELKKSGFIIIDRTIEELETHFRKECTYLDKSYKIKPTKYRFKVKNALNMEREYQIYYLIIPPM